MEEDPPRRKVLWRECEFSETSRSEKIEGDGEEGWGRKEGKDLSWLTILVFGDVYGIPKFPGPIMDTANIRITSSCRRVGSTSTRLRRH